MQPVKIRSVLTVYWDTAREYKYALFGLFICIVFTGSLALITPLFYKQLFDMIVTAKDLPGTAPHLVIILFYILAANSINWVFNRTASYFDTYFHSRMTARVRQKSFDYLLKHSYTFFANTFGGALVQKTNRLAKSFERILDRLLWDLTNLLVRIIGITAALWYFNRTIALVFISWITAFIFLHFFLSHWKLKYDVIRAAKDSHTTAVLADAITNHTAIQIFTGFIHESKRYRDVTEDYAKSSRTSSYIGNTIDAIQASFFVLVEFFILYLAISYWKQGILTLGTIVLIQSYLGIIIGRLWDLGRVVRDIYESVGDAKEMVALLELPHEIKDAPEAPLLRVPQGKIEFKNVSFKFHQKRDVIRNITLTIKPGEKIALIGPSGAGKSTLIRLLFRFYETGSGEIRIDGQNIAQVKQDSLRSHLSLVPQDPVLFHRTLLDNIRYGKKDAKPADVRKAAHYAHCDDFIDHLPKQYETYVGERGIKLSGGERQRIAIARAMLKNAPILVLDEATSSLDSHSEMLIQDALEKLMQGKTTIVIAHRLSTIRKMDRIIVLDKGRIIEEGTHVRLLKKNSSLYRKLWSLQSQGFVN